MTSGAPREARTARQAGLCFFFDAARVSPCPRHPGRLRPATQFDASSPAGYNDSALTIHKESFMNQALPDLWALQQLDTQIFELEDRKSVV